MEDHGEVGHGGKDEHGRNGYERESKVSMDRDRGLLRP